MHRIYEVTRWGNDIDPESSADTSYLVIAPDHEAAARLVTRPGSEPVDNIYELGVCTFLDPAAKPVVLRGPYVQLAANPAGFVAWSWEEPQQAWFATPHARHGKARCSYPDGAPAAEMDYFDGRIHGQALRWHPNGQLFSREAFVGGVRHRSCEWWFADGQPWRVHTYVPVSRIWTELRWTEWDREGRQVGAGSEQQRTPRWPKGAPELPP